MIVADYAARVGAGEQYLAEEAERQLALIRKRRAQYASLHTSVSAKGRTVIVVDDGLATGATMRAALDEIRHQQPARLVCAVPVASPDAAAYVRPFCDEWVFLAVEPDFDSVGWFYRDFRQVEDEEAVALLAQSGNPAG